MLTNLIKGFRAAGQPFVVGRQLYHNRKESAARAHIAIDFSVRNFRIKTASSPEELGAVLQLRRKIFHHEFAGRKFSFGFEKDRFDDYADQLCIFDTDKGEAVGVYRLISSRPGVEFYSSTEYDITRFLNIPGKKLELSRACIAQPYRTGVVMSLLWRGLALYAQKSEADYLFGLSSISTMDVSTIAQVTLYLEQNNFADKSLGVTPLPRYWISALAQAKAELLDQNQDLNPKLLPSLLKSYLKAGALVCSHPVIDRRFRCADWFTVLELRQLKATHGRRYMPA